MPELRDTAHRCWGEPCLWNPEGNPERVAASGELALWSADGTVNESYPCGALNSAVECHLHTVEVVGSNPAAPTIKSTTYSLSGLFPGPNMGPKRKPFLLFGLLSVTVRHDVRPS
jgi:hypothetical protein